MKQINKKPLRIFKVAFYIYGFRVKHGMTGVVITNRFSDEVIRLSIRWTDCFATLGMKLFHQTKTTLDKVC